VFLDDLGPFRTTRFALEEALAFHKASPLSRQLEIETYTWDVLREHLQGWRHRRVRLPGNRVGTRAAEVIPWSLSSL
jgi:hypothetical protein